MKEKGLMSRFIVNLPGVSIIRCMSISILIKYSNFSRFYK